MSRWKSAIAAAVAVGMSGSAFAAVAFTPGDLVVYRVGDGSAALSSAATAVFLDEYTTAGALVQSVPMPTAASGSNNMLTASGSATSEGLITLSSDGHTLLVSGYNAAVGTAGVAGTSTGGATPVLRVLGAVDANANVNSSTTTTAFSANNPRSVASQDGITLFASGANSGVVAMSVGGSGAGTSVSTTVANLRQLEIYGGQLYTSTSSGSAVRIGTVGSGVSTTTGQTTTNLPGYPTSGSPYAFYMADLSSTVAGLDTLYVAEDTASGGQIQKYTLSGGGTWSASGTATAAGIRGLTGVVDGSGNVDLYGTTGTGAGSGGGTIYSFVDSTGYGASIVGSASSLVAISTTGNETIRGIAFVPTAAVPEPGSLGLIALAGGLLLKRGRRRSA